MSHSRPEPPAESPRPATDRSTSYTALACLVGLAAIWGYNWVAMKVGVRYAEPFTFAALRAFLGAVCLFPLAAALRRPLRLQAPFLTAAVGILQTTAFVGLTLWALERGAAGRTSVLVYTMPFWLLTMAWVFLGERIRGSQWMAVGLALLGLVFILRPWRMEGTAASSLLAVAAGFCWAASAVLVKIRQRRKHVDLLSFTAWQMLIGAIPLVIIAILRADTPPQWNAPFVAALTFNVLPANALAWLLWLFVLRTLPAGTAGVGTLAIPVVGVAAAWLQLGERPSPLEGAGMLFILLALGALTVRGLVLSRRAYNAPTDR
jgi:drug/metabolite transporter (DMT)-like permease